MHNSVATNQTLIDSNMVEGKANKRVSSIDVARLAGVSQAAVSRTFTPRGSVSDKTRQKVLAAAKKLGYTPNVIARSLIQQSTKIIGIVMVRFQNPFYANVLGEITRKLNELGYRTLLINVAHSKEVDEALPKALQYQADGIIITSATLSSKMADGCARAQTPVVLFNRYDSSGNFNAIYCDSVGGGRLVADALLDAGHQRLAFIAGEKDTSTSRDREKGFTEGIRARGDKLFLRENGDYTYEAGYSAAERLLKRKKRPDAIFCANDLIAMGALDYARGQLGIQVPQELSIVGFDDIPMAGWPGYSLTTIRQPVDWMVDATIERLMRAIKAPGAETVMKKVHGILVERDSARTGKLEKEAV